MHQDPSLLLIQPISQQKAATATGAAAATTTAAAAAAVTGVALGAADVVAKVEAVAENVDSLGSDNRPGEVVLCCLQFLAVLLRNCVNKHVFSSSEVCVCFSRVLR